MMSFAGMLQAPDQAAALGKSIPCTVSTAALNPPPRVSAGLGQHSANLSRPLTAATSSAWAQCRELCQALPVWARQRSGQPRRSLSRRVHATGISAGGEVAVKHQRDAVPQEHPHRQRCKGPGGLPWKGSHPPAPFPPSTPPKREELSNVRPREAKNRLYCAQSGATARLRAGAAEVPLCDPAASVGHRPGAWHRAAWAALHLKGRPRPSSATGNSARTTSQSCLEERPGGSLRTSVH